MATDAMAELRKVREATAQRLIARADQIDSRLGPIPGRDADAIAVELREAARLLSDALSWRTMESAPKNIVFATGLHEYGPYILAYPVFGGVARVRWWQAKDDDGGRFRNWIEDGGNAVRPTHYLPLPTPPAET